MPTPKKKDGRYSFFEVSILNDEYKVYIHVGDRVKSNREICKYFNEKGEFIESMNRGKCIYHKDYHPCIWVDGTLDYVTASATLAHEAIHAVSYIMEYLQMDMRDLSGNEFLAHSVAAVMRKVLKPKKKITS